MESSKKFEFVRKAGFNSTFAIINKAMYYYESDSEVCCQKYRDVLEAILDDLFKIFDLML